MNSEINPHAFPALPVRRRETLEIFDTALKIYRRYFWVLLGWSALVAVMSLVPILNFFSFFAMPLLYGAVSCCVAAAVRGQKVRFSQCWTFTKPRYWPLLGVLFLSYLVLMVVFIALYLAAILLGVAGFWALSSAPEPVQIVAIVLGSILGIIAFSGMGVVAFGWMNMAPIVACLEDDKRGVAALSRAFELLKGSWGRVFGMSLILGLAVLAVFAIVGGIYSLIIGFASLRDVFGSDPAGSAFFGLMSTFGAFLGLFFLIWNPAQALVIAVLYLDLRVRREALDLEWTTYASAPNIEPAMAVSPAPNAFSAPETASQTAPTEFDFLRPTAISPVNTLLPVAEETPSSPASFAAGSSIAAGNLAAPPTSSEVVNLQKMKEPTPFVNDAAPSNLNHNSSELQNPQNEAQRD